MVLTEWAATDTHLTLTEEDMEDQTVGTLLATAALAILEMIIRVEEITTETVTTGLTTAQQIIAKDPTTQT